MILQWLFGCSHSNLSRVFTLRQIVRRATRDCPERRGLKRTYRTCLQCEKEFPLNWEIFGEITEAEKFERLTESAE